MEESRELKEYRREAQRRQAIKHSEWAQQRRLLQLGAGLAMHRRELSKVLGRAVQALAEAEKHRNRHGTGEGNGYAGMDEQEDELTNRLQDTAQGELVAEGCAAASFITWHWLFVAAVIP